MALAAVAGCQHRTKEAPAANRSATWAQLVARCGEPEVPRYIKFRELDPRDRRAILISPTLQQGRPGHPVLLAHDVSYLYSVATDGTFLVAEKRAFGSNAECGHPNLTGGKPARISGEINYDRGINTFIMDNNSGRYGYQLTRQPRQLDAARKLLQLVGVRTANKRQVKLLGRWIPPEDSPKYRLWDRMRPFLKDAPAGFDVRRWRSAFVGLMKYRGVDEQGCTTPNCLAAH